MTIIDSFLERYLREYDYYSELARICAQRCESGLEQNGVRALVTYRAKRPDRLREKIISRNEKAKYKTEKEIYDDTVDLAGVRIALYFPDDIGEVERIIENEFEIKKVKIFPKDSPPPKYPKRFSGYSAKHYRVAIKPASLAASNRRYGFGIVEIQIASVLVHAWSEVEHDLVYKPLSGILSEDEHAILDELNGLTLAGEIALERLHRAATNRLKNQSSRFNNHYELAEYIYGKITRKK